MGNSAKQQLDNSLTKRKFRVYDPVFNQAIYVFINCEPREFDSWQKSWNVVNPDGMDPNLVAFSTHISAEGESNKYVIWINEFDWTLSDQESLIHEIIHTVIRIWEANNIAFSTHTQEFYAHSVGRLYSMIGAKLMLKPRKKRAKTK